MRGLLSVCTDGAPGRRRDIYEWEHAPFHPRTSPAHDASRRPADRQFLSVLLRALRARSSDRGYRLPILISLGAFLTVLLFFFEARSEHRLPGLWVYWIALAMILVPGILSRHRVATMTSIGLFAFIQCFSYVLSAPHGIVFSADPIYNLQGVTLLAGNGYWTPGWGTEQTFLYSFYPAKIFVETAFAFTTGLPLGAAFMVTTSILRFGVLPLAFFKIARRFLPKRSSLVASAVLLATPSYIFNLPVLQEFAIVFLVLSLYAIFLASSSNHGTALSRPAMATAMVLLTVVAMSHYFTAYIFAFFLAALAFSSFLDSVKRKIIPGRASAITTARALRAFRYAAPAYACTFLVWSILVSNSVDIGWFQYGERAFQESLSPGSLDRPLGSGPRGVRPGYTYSTFELGLIGVAVLLWLVTAFRGLLLVRRRVRRGTPKSATAARLLLVLFVPCLMLVFVTAPLVFSHGFFIPFRVFEYGGLGLAPLMALSITRSLRRRGIVGKAIVAGTVAILVIGGSLLQTTSPRLHYVAPEARYSAMPTHQTPDVVEAALWANRHIPRNANVFGDELTYEIFGGYGQFTPYNPYFGGYDLFNASVLNATNGYAFGLRAGDVIVVHVYLTTSICFASFRDTPFPQAKMDKFADNPILTRLYQNSEVTLYRWEGPE